MNNFKHIVTLFLAVMAFQNMAVFAMDPSLSANNNNEQTLQSLLELAPKQFEEKLKDRPNLINAQDHDGKTLLMKAVEQEKPKYVRTLLIKKADPWKRDNNGECAFHKVCKVGDLAIARLLLAFHKNNQEKNWELLREQGSGFAPEYYAQQINKYGVSILFSNFNQSQDPLFQALLFGDIPTIDKILEKDPKRINEVVPTEHPVPSTPITWAVHLEDEKLIEHLLKKGAQIEKTSAGLNAYDWSSPRARDLIQRYCGHTLKIQEDLFNAIQEGNDTEVRHCLNMKPSLVNSKWWGITPIRCAVKAGRVNIVKILIDKGADLSLATSNREHLLLLPCLQDNLEMIRYLAQFKSIDYNFDRSKVDWPFNYPISQKVKDEIFALFDKYLFGKDDLQTRLSNAALKGRKELVDRELARGADINGFDCNGNTALHQVCTQGDPESIALLIDRGINLDLVDRDKKRNGLRWLLRMHKSSVQKNGRQITTSELLSCFFLLLCAGADPEVKDNFGHSVVDWIKVQRFNQQERKLIDRVLNAKSLSKEKRKLLLEDIYAFQKDEISAAQAAQNNNNNNNSVKYSDYDIRQMNTALVKKESIHDFKDIYIKYIK